MPMNKRTLGRTGLRVSEVGYGAWGIGAKQWIGASDDESLRALHRAIDLGLNFIDTALAYGDGHSEKLVGQTVRGQKEKVFVATKIPPKNRRWPAEGGIPVDQVYSADYVVSCTEESLRNLGMETIDLQQLHVWTDEFVGAGDWLEGIEKLKKQGKIRHFGISLGEHTPENGLRAVESGLVDTVQVIYNIFDQSPEDQLFPLCLKKNVGVLARVPFDEGGLTGKVTPETQFPKEDFRNSYFKGARKQEVYARVQKIATDLGISLDQLPETALRFVLAHPAVSTVIPGMRSVRNAEANCRSGDGQGLPEIQRSRLRPHRWIRNYYR
ncbi:MAG TPA: aldo/keto reductase [Planctomycetota bacterium]|nr:aldo/keto reductase [Planctomycetota bacterium]